MMLMMGLQSGHVDSRVFLLRSLRVNVNAVLLEALAHGVRGLSGHDVVLKSSDLIQDTRTQV